MKNLIFGFLQIALMIGLLNATNQTKTTPTPPAGGDTVLFNNGNVYGVSNGPTVPTKFAIRQPHVITMIMDYHWNNGRGTRVGTIGLRDTAGRNYGPWPVKGTLGQRGVPNANWTATPNVKLPAGEYTIIDSEPSTWSRNSRSGNRGFSTVKGYPWKAQDPTPTPTPNPTPKPTGQLWAIVEDKVPGHVESTYVHIWVEGRPPRSMQEILEHHMVNGQASIRVSIPPDGRIKFVAADGSTCTWTGDPKDPSRLPKVAYYGSGNMVCGTYKK